MALEHEISHLLLFGFQGRMGWDLNPRTLSESPVFEAGALSRSATHPFSFSVAGGEGFEPSDPFGITRLPNVRDRPLCHPPSCGGGGIRTHDPFRQFPFSKRVH